jgi:hypothetical protein
MASYMEFVEYWQETPRVQVVVSPPCCWVILSKDGKKALTQRDNLPVFEEWPDAQSFIEKTEIEGLRPKLLYWDDLVREVRGKVREIILDMGNGNYISFPPVL